MYWRYDLPAALTAGPKRKVERRETCTVTIYLLGFLGMAVTASAMLELVGDYPSIEENLALMCCDTAAAVSWVYKYDGARDKGAGLIMRMLGRLEITGRWSNTPSTSLAPRTY